MKKILVIEDNSEINAMLCEMLHKEDMEPQSAFSGTEGLLYMKQESFACILLDLMLPGKSGEETLLEIRKMCKTPVIVISAKNDIDVRVALLKTGADDYITKPFDLREVMARIRLQLHKTTPVEVKRLTAGNLVLDQEQHTVMVCGKELGLKRQEFNILETLMLNPKKVFTKQELFESAWEEYYIGADKTINVHISNIRSKMKQITEEEYIETIWGIGFRWRA